MLADTISSSRREVELVANRAGGGTIQPAADAAELGEECCDSVPSLDEFGQRPVGAGLATAVAVASSYTTSYDPMMTGDNGWSIDAAFTVGETVDGYTPVGVLDGTGALRMSKNTVRVFVNHELGVGAGKSYTLASGATLTGARISYFDFDRKTRDLCGAGEAFDTIFDRNGDEVTSAAQIGGGLNRLCSAKLVEKGTYGFRDDIF